MPFCITSCLCIAINNEPPLNYHTIMLQTDTTVNKIQNCFTFLLPHFMAFNNHSKLNSHISSLCIHHFQMYQCLGCWYLYWIIIKEKTGLHIKMYPQCLSIFALLKQYLMIRTCVCEVCPGLSNLLIYASLQ